MYSVRLCLITLHYICTSLVCVHVFIIMYLYIVV